MTTMLAPSRWFYDDVSERPAPPTAATTAPFGSLVCTEAPEMGKPLGENVLRRLAKDQPTVLIDLAFRARLGPADLTYVGEALGQMVNTSLALAALKQLAHHSHPMVREGVVLGASHLGTPDAKALVLEISEKDVDGTVRSVAQDSLDSFTE